MTTWAGQRLISLAGASRRRLLVLMMVLVSGLTALISINAAVAALLPVVVVMAVRLNQFPSRLLLPLAFAAHAGSMLALTGTPVNVLVAEAAADAGVGRFGFFEFTLVGSRCWRARSRWWCCSAGGCCRNGRCGCSLPT